MYQASHLTSGRTVSRLKALVSMKSVYTLAFAALLASATLVAFPTTRTLAADCSAACNGGETISIKGATTCSCTDYQGCTWTSGGTNYASSCGTKPVGLASVEYGDY